jgi:tRNA-dihydrouridine synthase
MIGRCSFWNPWCFTPGWYTPTLLEVLETMIFHAEKLVSTKWEARWCLEIRKHLVQYLKWFPGVKVYRKRLVQVKTLIEVHSTINDIRTEFKDFLDKKPTLWEISDTPQITYDI